MNDVYLKNVSTLKLDRELCIDCGTCIDVCPREVLAFVHHLVQITNKDNCIECGACQNNCPSDAILVDSGVGCATAMIIGAIRGTEPTCGCDDKIDDCC